MKRIIVTLCLIWAFSLSAVAPKRGKQQLRELAVFPAVSMGFHFVFGFKVDKWDVTWNENEAERRAELQRELKQNPDDFLRQLELGNLLETAEKTNEARVCFGNAERLARTKVAALPQSGLALTDLGQAIHNLDKTQEAETCFRKATMVSSNEWKCWSALGLFLEGESIKQQLPEDLRESFFPSSATVPDEIINYRPTLDVLRRAEELRDEASRCLDRAVQLAPTNPTVLLQRAGYLCLAGWGDCFIRHIRDGDSLSGQELTSAYFCDAAISNMEEAARRDPNNYRSISLPVLFRFFQVIGQQARSGDTLSASRLDDIHQLLTKAIVQLEAMKPNPDKRLNVGKQEMIGAMAILAEQNSKAESALRDAVRIDPASESAWDMLTAALVGSESWPELLSVCEARLKARESARNHLLLSKALSKVKKWKTSTEEAEKAAKSDPDDIIPHLMLVALDIRMSGESDSLSLAEPHMSQSRKLLETISSNEEKAKRSREFYLNFAIILGLIDQPDDARNLLESILTQNPEDETAKAIKSALP